ncbi:precorrin-2 dehydrogenase/sirohydrochlorin ferrochelatase family protein [Halonatronum saccharophilum]|uniref:precorrin-2 dehydrogenase/sirohydrochlorin ferrochelatase family protein n=1 Tax=Halonatronum saccharophilum TaxID=150060 RepID=UPI0004B0F1DB|nr:bifunctional precorrin-2 dehydrogenase/sirohydrochlorin ferrochelatase [Halonatronum saccharophilum]
MEFYPINLRLEDKKVLVVGGGKVAYRKLKRLVKVRARVTVVGPQIIKEVEDLIKEAKVEYHNRSFFDCDIHGYFLIIAATDNKEVNARIGELADQKGILVNIVDDKELSNFTLPSVVNRGDLLLTISTGGNLPALSKKLRIALEKEFGEEYGEYLKLMGDVRELVKEQVDDEGKRRDIFKRLAKLEMVELFLRDREEAVGKIDQIIGEG